MKRSLIIVLGALAAGLAVFAGSYLAGQRAGVIYCANPADDLSWLRTEFHLTDADMARVRQLHESYMPQCMKMCAMIAAKKAEIRATLAIGIPQGGITADAEKKLAELGELRAQCQAQMLRQFIAVSQAMPPEEGRRYLSKMETITLGAHEEIEQSMSDHAGHEHGAN